MAAIAPPVAKDAPRSARGANTKEELPKTTMEQDIEWLKGVTEATTVSSVLRACYALKNYCDNKDIVINACQALSGLAMDNPKKQTLIQQKGGITHLLAAMKKHSTDVKIQEETCLCLIALCDQHDANANLVAKPAIPILMEQLKANEKNVEFVADGVHAMDIVCAAASGRKEAATKGVAQLTMELMSKHTQSSRIQERGSGVLRHISSDPAGKKIITDNGGVNLITGMKKLYPNSSIIDENVTETLKRLGASPQAK